jgi:hypothetical protein
VRIAYSPIHNLSKKLGIVQGTMRLGVAPGRARNPVAQILKAPQSIDHAVIIAAGSAQLVNGQQSEIRTALA